MKKSIIILICVLGIFVLSQCEGIDRRDSFLTGDNSSEDFLNERENSEDILNIDDYSGMSSTDGSNAEGSWILSDGIGPLWSIGRDASWDGSYSTVACIARITENNAAWSLCTMDINGKNMRTIVSSTVGCQKPVRSYSGTRLLFSTVTGGNYVGEDGSVHIDYQYGLYFVNMDGSGLTLIDQSKESSFRSLDWSPDDQHIVYTKSPSGDWTKNVLVLYNIEDKSHTILLTEGGVISNMKFSPDGSLLLYCSRSEDGHHIYALDVNGTNKLLIRNASCPEWSYQGDKIAYLSAGEEGSSQIFVADADGNNSKKLTKTISPDRYPGWPPDGNSDPQWTPDGEKIVYTSWENGRNEVFIMNVDGSKQTRLTKAEFRDDYPAVTPDGKYILFSSRRSGMMDTGICIMNLDGKGEKVLSNTGIHPVVCR